MMYIKNKINCVVVKCSGFRLSSLWHFLVIRVISRKSLIFILVSFVVPKHMPSYDVNVFMCFHVNDILVYTIMLLVASNRSMGTYKEVTSV